MRCLPVWAAAVMPSVHFSNLLRIKMSGSLVVRQPEEGLIPLKQQLPLIPANWGFSMV